MLDIYVIYLFTYFGGFCHQNGHCIRKSIALMFMSALRNEFMLL